MARFKISKIEATRRQIDTAIFLWAHGFEPEPIHTLAAASLQILRDISTKSEGGFLNEFESVLKPDKIQFFWARSRKLANFLKHADNDPDAVFEDFDTEINEWLLLFASIIYNEETQDRTPEMSMLFLYLSANNPDILVDAEGFDQFFEVIDEFSQKTKDEQLDSIKYFLSHHRGMSVF